MLDVKRLYLRRISIVGAAGTNVPDVYKALEAAHAGKIKAIPTANGSSDSGQAHRIVENKNQIIGIIIRECSRNRKYFPLKVASLKVRKEFFRTYRLCAFAGVNPISPTAFTARKSTC